jgi:hypothetical protein
LVAALVGCGDDGGDDGASGNAGGNGGENTGGENTGGNNTGGQSTDKPRACDVVSADTVSEIAGVTLGSEPMDSPSVSVCSYASEDVPFNLSLRIEYNGADYLEKTVEALEKLGGSSEEVSGIGGFSAGVGSFLVTKGRALVVVTVGDNDLAAQRGREVGEEIARLSLDAL